MVDHDISYTSVVPYDKRFTVVQQCFIELYSIVTEQRASLMLKIEQCCISGINLSGNQTTKLLDKLAYMHACWAYTIDH